MRTERCEEQVFLISVVLGAAFSSLESAIQHFLVTILMYGTPSTQVLTCSVRQTLILGQMKSLSHSPNRCVLVYSSKVLSCPCHDRYPYDKAPFGLEHPQIDPLHYYQTLV